MGCTTQLRNGMLAAVVGTVFGLMAVAPASAVEMFTYFGDGSSIGLPSLEVPIEAYPGIPLRSDRLRARRAGKAPPRGTVGQFRGRGITIRVPAQQPIRSGPMSLQPPLPETVPAAAPLEPVPAAVREDAPPRAESGLIEKPQRGASLDFGGLRDLSGYEQSLHR